MISQEPLNFDQEDEDIKQEIFDRAYRGLASQNWQPCFLGSGGSPRESSNCVYRKKAGDQTLACGIGHCLTDEQIAEEVPDPFTTLRPASAFRIWPSLELAEFADDLQDVHDSVAGEMAANRMNSAQAAQELREEMEAFATCRGLSFPNLDV